MTSAGQLHSKFLGYCDAVRSLVVGKDCILSGTLGGGLFEWGLPDPHSVLKAAKRRMPLRPNLRAVWMRDSITCMQVCQPSCRETCTQPSAHAFPPAHAHTLSLSLSTLSLAVWVCVCVSHTSTHTHTHTHTHNQTLFLSHSHPHSADTHAHTHTRRHTQRHTIDIHTNPMCSQRHTIPTLHKHTPFACRRAHTYTWNVHHDYIVNYVFVQRLTESMSFIPLVPPRVSLVLAVGSGCFMACIHCWYFAYCRYMHSPPLTRLEPYL
jgi:hypothetical protein